VILSGVSVGRGGKRINGEYGGKQCAHVWKWENATCWNYSRDGGRGIKDNDGGAEFNYDMLKEIL
jgi:hypothetical protein